ncbi:FCD domain-containing protein [Prosthecomicrobium pneumaticum]|uniref:DNA-binding FadR family transcriptional regulator n=1 Tax=Prosthecomicrobium pneumaticum TaxID=81895 RepID=A0A7W9CTZ2_9HYPH|nr:DNA-binding FadR family transcriptional regulator [Prosthecomicrobium pneumaticum]
MDLVDLLARVNAPSSVSQRRLHGSVAHQLAVMIIGGRLKPGEVLPNEDLLSAQLSVSRTAYREAMRILVAKGLVKSRPKAGTTVNPRSEWNILDPDVLSWHFEVEPSPSFIIALFELRRIIEPAGAAIAAERRTADDLAAMRSALEKMRTMPPGDVTGLDADLAFHHTILVAAKNEALQALTNVIGSTLRWSVRLKITADPLVYETSLPDHVAVMEAIERQDAAEASGRMTILVNKALSDTLRTLESQSR